MTRELARSRVYLRPPSEDDREEYLTANRASIRLFRGVASAVTTPMAFAKYLARVRRSNHSALLVCRRSDDAIVGAFNVSEIVRGTFQSAYLGYQVFGPYAAQGYMSEALPLVLRHVFVTLKLHRIEANIQPSNRRSVALVRRAGFSREGYSPRYLKICGRWRDHERWALLVDDWKRR